MNTFEKWWENIGYFEFKKNELDLDPVELSRESWNAAKEEVLRILFLNTKTNGKHTIDIDAAIKEIEKL